MTCFDMVTGDIAPAKAEPQDLTQCTRVASAVEYNRIIMSLGYILYLIVLYTVFIYFIFYVTYN